MQAELSAGIEASKTEIFDYSVRRAIERRMGTKQKLDSGESRMDTDAHGYSSDFLSVYISVHPWFKSCFLLLASPGWDYDNEHEHE